MYKDAKEELQRLENALLEEELPEIPVEEGEELDSLLAETRRITGLVDPEDVTPDMGATRRIYNADRTDVDIKDYTEQVMENTGSLTGLSITAAVLAAGIIGVLLWWFLRYGGILG